MIYLFYGLEDFLIDKEIEEIKIKNSIEQSDISKYDLNEIELKSILDDASTISLFSNRRMIIVDNSNIFTGLKEKIKQDTKPLEKYLNNPNSDTILVFKVLSEKLDSRKKIVSLMKEKGIIKEFKVGYELNKLVKDMFSPYKISDNDLNLFISRVGSNLRIIDQEVKKLKTYKDTNFNIEREDILGITVNNIDVDIFHFIENIVFKRKKEALESYYEMLKLGEEPIKIIVILANQFRLLFQVKRLSIKRNSIDEIASILSQKRYTIQKALEKATLFKEEELISYLNKLAKLDSDIKNGIINKDLGLELFIIEN